MTPEAISEQLKGLTDQYPWALMLAICIGFGAAMKRADFEWFPPKRIPVAVAIFSMVFYPAWLFFQGDDYRYNLIFANAAVGAVLGLGSTGIHQLIKENKDMLAKIPGVGLLVKVMPLNGDTAPPFKPKE